MGPRAILAAIVVVILVIVAAAAAFVLSGAYDVGADAPHTGPVASLIGFARERSIDVRAGGIKVPPLTDPTMIAEGAEHYAAMCTGCHLAPGMGENELRPGLNPMPPDLALLPQGEPGEQFWIIKHGVKMTAMPAWGKSHSDEEIWTIVAFLQKLPHMPVAQYRALARNAGMHHAGMGH